MKLIEMGFTKELKSFIEKEQIDESRIGRVTLEHKKRYIVKTENSEFDCEVVGKLMHDSNDSSDFPSVGDWVSLSNVEEDKATIDLIFPRNSTLERRAVGMYADKQIIATNIDFAMIVQAVDRDFSINRIERYLTICAASAIKPIIILSKADLISRDELKVIINEVKERIHNIEVVAISSLSSTYFDKIENVIEKGKTYCLLGSSGVGKSTLINSLVGYDYMQTGKIGLKTNRGIHVTTHRELVVLENGGIIIDNPGMREVGISGVGDGIDLAFSEITELSKQCKFNDCKHTVESGCAVQKALDNNELNRASYDNYARMKKEADNYQTNILEKKYRSRDLSKSIKSYKKHFKRKH